ncbi:class I SAM-dependent methyltransferase [Histidinibacterium aquaticum]|uniref:class I SAM-dependent methyltransferase n=1 Tax=Histidinibacterium aquaticum TaxID=2613962 RepID=UPI00168B61E0|nr:class I SAM-dependent methyltransferase [Histidinibacterium aquaticum]
MAQYDNCVEMKGWRADDFGSFDKGEAAFFQAEVGRLLAGRKAETPVRVLELGFGNGAFMGWARQEEFEILGTEIQPELRRRAESLGFEVAGQVEGIETASLDACVAFDVFEHIPHDELIMLCKEIHRCLKPGGHLVARFPNGDSPFSMPNWNGDATHKSWLGQNSIAHIMEQSGLDLVELRAPSEPCITPKDYLTRPLKLSLRSGFRLLAKAAFLGGSAPATFHMNYMLHSTKRG